MNIGITTTEITGATAIETTVTGTSRRAGITTAMNATPVRLVKASPIDISRTFSRAMLGLALVLGLIVGLR